MWCTIASNLGEVIVRFSADTVGLNQGIANSISRLTSFGAVVGAIGVGAVAGLIGIGVASTKMAGDFQQGITRLVTGAGDVTDNMKVMGKGILDASVATGVLTSGTDGLNAAMYQIISSGQRGAQALNTLTVAAKGSQIEQANVVDVSKALTTAMTDYGTKQYDATQFMNGYIAAVSRGKITLEELSSTMGPILPLAKNLGISFADVSAAMSTMTNAGIPASRAATSLRFLFQSLEEPTKKASTAMKQWGVDSVALGNELRVSLPGALEMIYNAAKKAGPEGSVPFNRAVADMIGGQRSLQAYLALTGTHFATFSTDAKQIAAAMDGSKSAVNGWALAQGNFNIKMGEAHAALDAMFITIGTQLLPVMTQLAAGLVPIIQGFTSWAVSSGGLVSIIMNIVSFVSLLFAKLQANGALKEFLQILMNIGEIVRNVVNTALLILSGLFGTVSTNAGPAADAATNVAGALKKIADVGVFITGILKAVTGAFADTGAAGTLLRLALDGVAIAFVAIKIGNFINMFVTMLPLMIAGAVDMWAFAAAAWGAVVPLGILSLPLWAIILGIAVLVAAILGVIVAIRNWGNIVTWVGGVFSGLGTAVHNVILWIQGLSPWVQGLILGLTSLGAAIGLVVVAQLAWDAATATGGIIELITLIPTATILLGYWIAATWSAVASQVALKAVNAASVLVGFITMLPTVIALGWSWVAELSVQAIVMVAAYWPILLIIAGLASLIAIIVLVIAHWGQLSGIIVAACGAIKNTVGAAFNWLGTTIHDKTQGIRDFVGGAFDWIGTHIHDALVNIKDIVGGGFDWLGTHVHDKMTDIKNFVGDKFDWLGTHVHDTMKGMKDDVVGGFKYMYDHNYYIKNMTDQVNVSMQGMQNSSHTQMQSMVTDTNTSFSAMNTASHNQLTKMAQDVGTSFIAMSTSSHDQLTGMVRQVGVDFAGMDAATHSSLEKLKSDVGGAFQWLYDHNTKIKGLTDLVNTYFSGMEISARGSLSKMVSDTTVNFTAMNTSSHQQMVDIGNKVSVGFTAMKTSSEQQLNDMVFNLSAAFSAMQAGTHSGLVNMSNDVGTQFSTMGTIANLQATLLEQQVGRAFSNLGTVVHGSVAFMWNDVTLQFAGAWGRIGPVLSGLWSNISGWFTRLASQAFNWGSSVLSGFINGFQSMMGNLGNALGDAANSIANFLGFHSSEIGPTKEGPGQYLAEWGPGIINGIANGMLSRQGQLKSALATVLHPFIATSGASLSLSNATNISGSRTIVLEVDGRALGHAIATNMASEIRLKMGVF